MHVSCMFGIAFIHSLDFTFFECSMCLDLCLCGSESVITSHLESGEVCLKFETMAVQMTCSMPMGCVDGLAWQEKLLTRQEAQQLQQQEKDSNPNYRAQLKKRIFDCAVATVYQCNVKIGHKLVPPLVAETWIEGDQPYIVDWYQGYLKGLRKRRDNGTHVMFADCDHNTQMDIDREMEMERSRMTLRSDTSPLKKQCRRLIVVRHKGLAANVKLPTIDEPASPYSPDTQCPDTQQVTQVDSPDTQCPLPDDYMPSDESDDGLCCTPTEPDVEDDLVVDR